MRSVVVIASLAVATGSYAQHQHHDPPKQPTPPPAEKPNQPAKPALNPKLDAKPTPKPKRAQPGQHQHETPAHEMKGTQGEWSMARQGSGTSWMPDSSPTFMKMLPMWNGYEAHLMGSISANYADAGGRRGDRKLFSNSMAMLMLRRGQADGGVLGFQFMASLDPLFNGKKGYPNLFQTGETANGEPLKDRQHPHDLLSEAAVTYSRPVSSRARAIGYLGIAGEPALGGSMFMMRPSGMENPESPISHHWFDSTHISFGVATLGLAVDDKWKIEASAFNGTEPDEGRYDIDPIKIDSYSCRISHNPDRDWSFQVSYGFLREPEAVTEPDVSQHRLTGSLMHSRAMSNGDNASMGVFFGRNIKSDEDSTNAVGVEVTYFRGRDAYFGRLERVEKDELVDVPPGTYTVDKLTLGAVRNVAEKDGFEVGVGGFVGLHSIPKSLEPFYGKSPVSLGVFLRIRPKRVDHRVMNMADMPSTADR